MNPRVDEGSERFAMLNSLRDDVAQHPNDYVTFETGIAAQRFLAEHVDATRETDLTMVRRGVVGYWDTKTVAVVPSLLPWIHIATNH